MKPDKQAYQQMIQGVSRPSPKIKNCLWAFVVGGLLCAVGEIAYQWMALGGVEDKTARMLASVSLMALSAVTTIAGVFDKVAKHAGAGTLVPITGFANSVVSPAIEFKTEGFILGTAAKMFTIAGPVIVYGTVASVIYGVIYWVTTSF
ncbi:MAG: SpoVA/SpoVAEb family sporulation membrane protein [Clostridia bacterium]|nr:SpoVA/SpoVAEb family sporulation membrane protein [Clostridia bacterium]